MPSRHRSSGWPFTAPLSVPSRRCSGAHAASRGSAGASRSVPWPRRHPSQEEELAKAKEAKQQEFLATQQAGDPGLI